MERNRILRYFNRGHSHPKPLERGTELERILVAIRDGDIAEVQSLIYQTHAIESREPIYISREPDVETQAEATFRGLTVIQCIELDSRFRTSHWQSALHVACTTNYIENNLEILRLLLRRENQRICGYVNELTIFGMSALCIAAQAGHSHVVEMLLKHGADPRNIPFSNINALTMAIEARSLTCMQLLISARAGMNIDPMYERLPLGKTENTETMQAALQGRFFEGMRLLLNNGYTFTRISGNIGPGATLASINETDTWVHDPLWCAIGDYDDNLLWFLFFHGIDLKPGERFPLQEEVEFEEVRQRELFHIDTMSRERICRGKDFKTTTPYGEIQEDRQQPSRIPAITGDVFDLIMEKLHTIPPPLTIRQHAVNTIFRLMLAMNDEDRLMLAMNDEEDDRYWRWKIRPNMRDDIVDEIMQVNSKHAYAGT
ncbi:ankyrin repeat-containing domain protein [Baffinella frigidus]|nr:ankyrin repeat-containing domain protein [Cryptophyta sp. CCMP2293]